MVWPKMMNKFAALQRVAISSFSAPEDDLPVRNVDLHDIPSSVKSIRLEFYNAEMVWLGVESVCDDWKADALCSPRNYSDRLPHLSHTALTGGRDLSASPPTDPLSGS